ncbi:Afadin and alpha-actinin-binding-domain-containing protein [Mycena pura]|uniref:Afadin and alpha-actinin-binding-domain-containing protein n=1 Tax=Mycena pura TaxID=153505 RepID=A0AAD6YMJ4_9AGAR|nr:Afadin and alpha-actinin-binding-domain-containing protein [Mycena pura]
MATAQTPKKGVHWGGEPNLYSPSTDASSEILSTSSLEYINSQLVAHGFAPAPGLSLDAISNANLERVVKCLLGMLSQRVEDMSRTEDLATKLRTLSYDHERVTTMHLRATETAASAEREANLHKSRSVAATRLLQASESAHKQTTAELQRARTALQALRATHQAELKKKEREVERMTDRWGKLADMQAKAAAAPSGLRCVNLKVVDGSEVLGKGAGLEERALEQAEQARQRLSEENAKLRGLLLGAVNEAQAMLYQARSSEKEDEPVRVTVSTLFPMAPQNAADEKLKSLLTALREAVARPTTTVVAPSPTTSPVPEGELARLQGIINDLKSEIERYQQESLTRAAETRATFDQFANDARIVDGDIGDASVELMIAPERDAEKERLEKIKLQLKIERDNFTEATLRLGHERAALEAERLKLLDEKRSWDVEKMLAELPPTPNPASPAAVEASRSGKPSRNSPRKSPAKAFPVGKAGANRKTARVSRRSSLSSAPRFQAAFETEVLPLSSLSSSFLPTSFVLPPPTPVSAFPAPTELLLPSVPSLMEVSPPSDATAESGPATPPNFRLPFPMAKPFAQHMIHAYSPAKPSPLSRILMLSNSPATPGGNGNIVGGELSTPLGALPEENEEDGALTPDELFPAVPLAREPTLAEELGVSESPPESPAAAPAFPPVAGSLGAGRGSVFTRDPARFTALEKGKGRTMEAVRGAGARAGTVAGGEKENGARIRRKMVGLPKVSMGASGSAQGKTQGSLGGTGKTGSRARVMAKLPASTTAKTTGPRRVLVDSAEAPTAGRGLRG